jgi:hypothetical protein
MTDKDAIHREKGHVITTETLRMQRNAQTVQLMQALDPIQCKPRRLGI